MHTRMIMNARALYGSFNVKWKSLLSHTFFVYYYQYSHTRRVSYTHVRYTVISKFNLLFCLLGVYLYYIPI